MDVVFTSSSLIQLIKLRLSFLLDLMDAMTPASIYDGVVAKGRAMGIPDSVVIDLLVKEGKIKVREVEDYSLLREILRSSALEAEHPLSFSEAEAIALAKEQYSTLISDEEAVRKVADVYGVPSRGTLFLLKFAYEDMRISKKDLLRTIDQLAMDWKLKAVDYKQIIEETKEL